MLIFWFSPRGEQTLLLVIALAFLAAAWQVCCLQRPFHREICRDLRGDRLHLVEGVGSFYRLCIHVRRSIAKDNILFKRLVVFIILQSLKRWFVLAHEPSR